MIENLKYILGVKNVKGNRLQNGKEIILSKIGLVIQLLIIKKEDIGLI